MATRILEEGGVKTEVTEKVDNNAVYKDGLKEDVSVLS